MTSNAPVRDVPIERMQQVYEVAKTPRKHGIVLRAPDGGMADCPSVYRFNGRWFMLYVVTHNKVGYETHLATSEDLLTWEPLGTVLPFRPEGWDRWQADGGIALVDTTWGGSAVPRSFDGKHWLSYLGGALQGYETDPLSIGIAWTTTPDEPRAWTRLANNPVLAPSDADVRPFERKTLYKSNIIWDESQSLGAPFVMFYNGKQEGPGTERIGIALSNDMTHWRRFGAGPVIDNGPRGISGDPQIVRMDDLWVMFYFGHVWKPKAFDTFACSYDLVNWTKWDGPHLVEPSEAWDATFAHKPWVIRWEGVVYHFYCAVGNKGRGIAVALS
jgi:predicted GH43/DUF377 family glycosyl hydrolase